MPRIRAILERVGFDVARAGGPMEHLSRGMQQKDVHGLTNEIQADHNASILLFTHDIDEAEELCDQIGIIVDGKLLAMDRPAAPKAQFRTETEIPTLEQVFTAATGSTLAETSA